MKNIFWSVENLKFWFRPFRRRKGVDGRIKSGHDGWRGLGGRFLETRRSAIAVTMAVALVPLVLLIGIAVDVTFLSQDRLQTTFASEAAAASATRLAAATYQLEVANNSGAPTYETAQNAALQSINAADVVGNLWFDANLGNYSIGSLNSRNTVTKYDGGTDGTVSTSSPPNFAATVSTNSSYPPIFNPLFGHPASQQWVYTTGGAATTQFAYAQILMMLDTSGSMLIGADSPVNNPGGTENDVLPMEQGTVCPAAGALSASTLLPATLSGTWPLSQTFSNFTHPVLTPTQPNGQNYLFSSTDGDNAYLSKYDTTPVANYPGTSDTDYAEKCTGTGTGYNGNNTAGSPCALACHTSTTISPITHQYADYYGLARSEGVKLRLDVLFSAAEKVIQDMQTSEAVANQLSVGVYQFNTDVFPIVNASTGGAGVLAEATSNLSNALSLVQKDDWQITPTEIVIPQLIYLDQIYRAPNAFNAGEGGDTDFPLSLNDLENGNAVPLGTGGTKQKLTVSGSGATEATPQKFMFIVTDGMEDDSGNNGDGNGNMGYNVEGEMTSTIEEGKGTGVCSYLKNTLKYTVYVLYVDYEPVSNISYYGSPGARNPNGYTTEDNTGFSNATSVQTLSAVQTGGTPTFATAPIALALKACASTTSDFYEASNSDSIQTALNQMLKSALASTIRLTN